MGSTADRILAEATRLFAQRGYEGTSVRAICEAAGANVNAVSYHFGSKQALYTTVIERFGGKNLESAKRILGRPPKDLSDFESRLLLFAEELLGTYLAHPEPLIICFNEWQQSFRHCDGKATTESLLEQTNVLVAFLRAAQRRRILRPGLDLEIIAGALLERLMNQVRYANAIHLIYDVSIREQTYRRHWTERTIDLLLHGAVRKAQD
ncbi:MAG: TetR family transcriptional regulator [Myxococcales bacterium]|nr:TetR family transcriptional regulator [Myxococcales bacterium]MDD9965569.1 TetR family transcriptional regulator [Myxococcales bacterium]